jgi:hypothetical protein
MERDCSRVRNNDQIPTIPVGLKVTPVEASAALPNGCHTKFFVDVYADDEHYYFLDNTPALFSFSPRSVERVSQCSFVVDGRTGQLIRPPKRYWNGTPYESPPSERAAGSAESGQEPELESAGSSRINGPLPKTHLRPLRRALHAHEFDVGQTTRCRSNRLSRWVGGDSLVMDISAEQVVAKELGGGERLLWSGQPGQGVRLHPADALLIPFSLMWGGFAIFWEYSVLSSGNAPLFFVLWGIPFVLVGVYVVVGRFFVDARQRAATFYGLTDDRVIIVSGLLSRQVKSLPLRSLSDVSISERSGGRGTITFGPVNPFYGWFAGTSWPGMGKAASPAFESIAEVRQAYELLREAQRQAA